jgi:alkaline phosphatase D
MDTPELSRRELLAAGGVALAASGAFPLTAVAARARRNPLARAGGFTSGVASGLPAPDGALLWTRLDDHAAPSARLRYEVATDRDFRHVVVRGEASATALRDATARQRVTGLQPDSEYFYRFATRTTASRVGRFKTLPPPDSDKPIRIAFFSCQRFEHGYFTPQAGIAADEDLDVVLSLGDYIYEEDATPINRDRFEPNGGPNHNTETLAQFRGRHRSYRSDVALQGMHAQHALIPIWDDCEVEGNWAGAGP